MTDKPKWSDLFGIDPDYTSDAIEEPTLTAAEVKVLTEAALRLGRKEAGEEIAAACEKARESYAEAMDADGERSYALAGTSIGLNEAAKIALRIGSLPSGAVPDERSGGPEHTEAGSETQAASNRLPAEALKAASLGIHCRMSIGRGNFIAGQTPTPTSDDLARAALEAAVSHLVCSCPVISDVDDHCPQHGRDT